MKEEKTLTSSEKKSAKILLS